MLESIAEPMKWVSALSTQPSLEAAIADVTKRALQDLQGKTPTVGFLFISSAFASEYPRLLPLLHHNLPIPALIGCSGGGIIGTEATGFARELEDEPALSLTVAHLPGVQVQTFHIDAESIPDLDSPPDAWINLIGVDPACQPNFVLLADPGSSKITDLLSGLDFAYPSAVKVGGLASGGAFIGATGLFHNRRLYREGTVGLALSGNLVLDAIVAQGCRPIGHPYRIVDGKRNILLELEEPELVGVGARSRSRTPLEILQEVIQDLSEDDRQLAQSSLFIGVARNEFKETLEHGDFLIRNLLGVDPRIGAIAIGDRVRPGQRIQFHLRDARASAEDLEMLLRRYQLQRQGSPSPVGALLFACLGRGTTLYEASDFDSSLFQQYLGSIPLGGFFCNGEIGPISNGTFLHGYTSVFGICRQP